MVARSIFKQADLQQLEQRIAQLRPENERRWGKLTAPAMVCHLIDSLEVAQGRAPASMKKTPLATPGLRWLVIYVLPWPKGKAQTVPELLKTKPANWTEDVARLVTLLRESAGRGAHAAWATHPAFGRISGRDYGTLIYRHFDHHLTQFGV